MREALHRTVWVLPGFELYINGIIWFAFLFLRLNIILEGPSKPMYIAAFLQPWCWIRTQRVNIPGFTCSACWIWGRAGSSFRFPQTPLLWTSKNRFWGARVQACLWGVSLGDKLLRSQTPGRFKCSQECQSDFHCDSRQWCVSPRGFYAPIRTGHYRTFQLLLTGWGWSGLSHWGLVFALPRRLGDFSWYPSFVVPLGEVRVQVSCPPSRLLYFCSNWSILLLDS